VLTATHSSEPYGMQFALTDGPNGGPNAELHAAGARAATPGSSARVREEVSA
jgi:hypothetical protein